MATTLTRVRQLIALGALCLSVLGACNQTSDEGPPPSAPRYWVYIDGTDDVVATPFVQLHGVASCDACPESETAFGYCPVIQGPIPSDVDVAWTNLTTMESDTAFHAISGQCSCLFSYCTVSYSHRWTAQVHLTMGPNVIELVAFGPFEDPGTDRVTITRLPAAPQGLEAESDHGLVVLRWSPVALATTYELYWSTSPDFDLATANRIPDVSSPYVHAGLADDVTHYYAVTAASGEYVSAPSTVAWATPGWRSEALPVADFPAYPVDASVAVDSLDRVHAHVSRSEQIGSAEMTYNDYVTDRDGAWTSIPVANTLAEDAEIALDSRDVVHVTYTGFQGPVHAVRPQNAWVTELVDSGLGCGTSLSIDSLDRVHVAYIVQTMGPVVTRAVRYATEVSGTWSAETVGEDSAGCTSSSSPSLALELDGTAHLVYVGPTPNYGVEYASNLGGSWSHSTIVPGYATGISLALDASGRPHVAYCDSANLLHLARRAASGAWEVEPVDASILAGSPSLSVDARGDVHVSYVSLWPTVQLRYAHQSAGTWSVLRVAPADGQDTALALDARGDVHIVYFLDGTPHHATNR